MSDLQNLEWKEFKISDLFDVNERGKRLVISKREDGNYPFVTAGESLNGISSFINNQKHKKYKNAITIDMFGNSFFQNFDFKCDDNITILKNNNINIHIGLFLIGILGKLKEKYSYGNQIRPNRLKKDKILLPVDKNGSPNWDFMEKYMKDIEQKMLNKVFKYYKEKLNSNGGGTS